MRKLGIDLGSSSLGWFILDEGETIKKGVVTFDTGMSKGQSGGYTSPTKERREERSKRNLIRARKYRKWELLKILIEAKHVPLDKNEFEIWSKYKKDRVKKFPENRLFLKWLACDFTYEDGIKYKNPYELRVKALDHKLSNHELGRALYHLVQRRGYKDIGETDAETEKQKKRRAEGGFEKSLEENRTIAETLMNDFLNKNKRARNQYPYREEYEEELVTICKAQGYDISKDEKGNYNDRFVAKLRKAIIWQRPLRTQKGNIGKCTLEPKSLRCPISHPAFEMFRTLQFINTIKYYDDNNEKKSLSPELRGVLFEWFLKKSKNFKFEDIRVFLDKKSGKLLKYNYPIDKDGKYDTSVSGMPICKSMIDIFGEKAKQAIDRIEIYNIGNVQKNGGFGNAPKIVDHYSINDLWHILFEFDENHLKDFATQKLHFSSEEEVNKFVKMKSSILQGYAELSLKAICKIIPFLREGYLYDQAVVLAKIPELFNEKWESEKNIILDCLKQAGEIYEWEKMIAGITNNLIDKYKGLYDEEVFAYKNFQYILDDSDIKDIECTCQEYFGKKSWERRRDKNAIIETVKNHYQDFFRDRKRAYREITTLADTFQKKLYVNKVEIDTKQLYHHSNIENKYLKKCKIDTKTEKHILPTVKNTNGIYVDMLPDARIDSIKNPMFNKSMSILRKFIIELIKDDIVNKETEVIIELARELNDNNKRIAIERYQNEQKNNRLKYRAFLEEFNEKERRNLNVDECISTFELWSEQIFEETEDENKQQVKNRNRFEILKEKDAITRYELWMEQKGQCMYTGKMISISQLFSNEIDIEHTVPRSLLPDNTMANKTVCFAWYNRDVKKKQMPFYCPNYNKDLTIQGKNVTCIEVRLKKWIALRDYYKKQYEDKSKSKGNENETVKNKRIQDKYYFKLHHDYWKDKIDRFEKEEVDDNWARRQLVDTQLVSKYAREFLKTYFKKVTVQKGTVTAAFRKIYGFQDEDEIKSRNKHTHHAIDAAVLTLIPSNSSRRMKVLKEYYKAIDEREKGEIKKIKERETPLHFNAQNLIQEIENSTFIINYEKNNILKQTKKKVRKRGRIQYLKDKKGSFILDDNGNKILLKSMGDTIRSTLYAQTYLGKIKDVERDELNLPKRANNDWIYKQGKDEFIFVKREDINKVKKSESLIEAIVDPIIRKLIIEQKNNPEIKDYQGNIIRHVRVKTNSGKEVKKRTNYCSKYDYKNKFYSEAGEVPYAILMQRVNKIKEATRTGHVIEDKIEREMIPIASFEVAKMYKKNGNFDVEQFVNDYHVDFKDWNKTLLKVGQKVFVLKEDNELEKINDVNFKVNRLYVITQFSEGSIWLHYHLNALSRDDVKNAVSMKKDELLRAFEKELDIPEVIEDVSIQDNRERKEDYEKRKYRFDTINNSFRLKRLVGSIGLEKTKEIKLKLDKYKAIPSSIEIEGETPLLKMSKENWNFLIEGKDFEIKLNGEIHFFN